MKEVIYLLALPLTLMIIIMESSRETVGHTRLNKDNQVKESEQFYMGHAWGEKHNPIRYSDCQGSTEFNRGCYMQIMQRRKVEEEAGRDWAVINQPRSAAQCRGKGKTYFVLGCRNYFFQYLEKPRSANIEEFEGMTTAECREDVKAKWEAIINADDEEGNATSFLVNIERENNEYNQCKNYDITAAVKAQEQSIKSSE